MPMRLPETFACLPVVAVFTSAMTPRMTLGTSVSGPTRVGTSDCDASCSKHYGVYQDERPRRLAAGAQTEAPALASALGDHDRTFVRSVIIVFKTGGPNCSAFADVNR